jgi:hypothetical protein
MIGKSRGIFSSLTMTGKGGVGPEMVTMGREMEAIWIGGE